MKVLFYSDIAVLISPRVRFLVRELIVVPRATVVPCIENATYVLLPNTRRRRINI